MVMDGVKHMEEAQQMKMVEVTDYNCAHTICANNKCNGKSGYCHANKNTAVGTYDENNIADFIVKMYYRYNQISDNTWTNTHFDSCMSYTPNFSGGHISYRRIDQKVYAVCKK